MGLGIGPALALGRGLRDSISFHKLRSVTVLGGEFFGICGGIRVRIGIMVQAMVRVANILAMRHNSTVTVDSFVDKTGHLVSVGISVDSYCSLKFFCFCHAFCGLL